MIHIEKKDANGNPINPPDSLISNAVQQKQAAYCSDNSITPNGNNYNRPSVRNALKAIYNNKCGYCEQTIRWVGGTAGTPRPQDANSIEHYRPKAANHYNWLAYSWDNLFLACIGCNNPKGNDFPLNANGTRITAARNGDIANIHQLATIYHSIELPVFPHPEIDFPENHLEFNIEGEINSNNADYQYFIIHCNLNRTELKDARKRIYQEEFEDEFKLIILSDEDAMTQKSQIITLIEAFEASTIQINLPFIGFRRYIYREFIAPIKIYYQ